MPSRSWTTALRRARRALALRARRSIAPTEVIRRVLDCMELEERTLLSSAPAALVASLHPKPAAGQQVRVDGPAASKLASKAASATQPPAIPPAAPPSVVPAHTAQVVLVDSQLSHSEQLMAAAAPTSKVFVYDSRYDTASHVLEQVAHWAEQTGNKVKDLAIVSHGVGGAFALGNEWITATSLSNTLNAWRDLNHVLAAGAKIELFGCNVATADGQGQRLLDGIAAATGAGVYASRNATGAGGDWVLEAASTGSTALRGADMPLDTSLLSRYAGVLSTIAIDTTTSAATVTGGATSLTFAHTVNSGSDAVLVVEVAISGNRHVASVTYGSQSLTFVGQIDQAGVDDVEIWCLVAPSVGTTNITVTATGKTPFTAGATDFFGVDQATPFGTPVSATGNTASATVTVASATGQLVIDAMVAQGNSQTLTPAASGQDRLWTQATGGGGGDALGAGSYQPGAASVTMSWLENNAHNWALVAVPLLPSTTNHAPQGTNHTATTLEDTAYIFTTADFGFSDPNDTPSNSLLNVIVTALPTAGTLTDNGAAVTAGQVVGVTEINAGQLVFTPALGATGSNYASFMFRVQDDGGTASGGSDTSAAATMRIDVTGLARAGGPYTMAEGDTLALDASTSSLPASGTATYSWDINGDGAYGDATGVAPSLTWAELQSLGINNHGTYAVTVRMSDGLGHVSTSSAAVLTVTNVAPTLALGGAATIASGLSYTLSLAATDPGLLTVNQWTINWGDGAISTLAGNPGSATHAYAQVGMTYSITASARDADGVWWPNQLVVSDSSEDGLFRYAGTSAAFLQGFGTGDQSTTADMLVGPDGAIYVSGGASNDVVRYDAATGARIGTFVPSGLGGLNQADGMAFGPDGNLYVASAATNQVLRYDGQTGAFLGAFVAAGGGGLDAPARLMFAPDGMLYVTSFYNNCVLRYDASTGNFLGQFVASGSGGLQGASGLAVGPDGNLYVASLQTNSILQYDGTTGAFLHTFVAAGSGGLINPSGIGFGPDGNLYVANRAAGDVLRFNGLTGAFVDRYVAVGSGGLTQPWAFSFLPQQQVTIGPSNHAPVLAGTYNLPTILENAASNGGTLVSTLIAGKVSDADAGALTGIAVASVDNRHGTWQYSTDGGSSWTNFTSPDTANARLLAADANTYVRFVSAANWSGAVSGGFDFYAWDQTSGMAGGVADASIVGGATAFSSTTAAASITVTHVNQPPQGTSNTVTTLENTSYSFAAADFGFSDPNDTPANSLLAVKVTSLPGAGMLTDNGAAVTAGQFVTVADINAGLLRFAPATDADGAGYASFTFQVQDDGGTANGGMNIDSSPRTMTFDVTHVNQPPVNAVPGAQITDQGVPLVFSAAGGNAITVADLDAGGQPIMVSLNVTHGTLTLAGSTGLTYMAGANGSSSLSVMGNAAAINAALEGMTFAPTTGYSGSAGLGISTNDLGNSGAGGPRTTTSSIGITVKSAQALTIAAPAAATSTPAGIVFSTANRAAIVVTDPSAAGLTIQVTITATGGSFTLPGTGSAVVVAGTTARSTSVTLAGTATQIDAAIDGLTFLPTAVTAQLVVKASDLPGTSDQRTGSATVSISQIVPRPPVPPNFVPGTTPGGPPNDSDKGPGDLPPSPPPPPPILPPPPKGGTTVPPEPRRPAPAAPSGDVVRPPASLAVAPWLSQASENSYLERDSNSAFSAVARGIARDVVCPLTPNAGRSLRAAVTTIACVASGTPLWKDLDTMDRRLMNSLSQEELTVGAALTVSTGLTVGYVIWMLRGGMLLSSLLAQMPAWRLMDPLVVLSRTEDRDGDEQESLETIVESFDDQSAETEEIAP